MQIVVIFLLFLNLIFIPYSKAQTEEIVFDCIIHNELENNKETSKKIYEKKHLDIFLDKENGWINDVQYKKWKKKNLNDQKRIEIFFYESKKKYFFEYKNFYNDDKDGILARAKMTEKGQLTERYSYLQSYVNGEE